MKKKIDVAIAFFNFLKAARNRVKEGMGKEQILAFAKQEFGEVTKLLRKQIDDLFKAKPKTQKKGDVVPIKKQEGLVRRPEEFATRKQYEKYLDETLGPSDDVFGNPIKEDLLKEWDKVKAKNVTPKKEGILATDEAAKIVKKRTDDIATGDPTGEVSEIMEGLGSLKNIKQGGKGLDPREGVVRAAAREILNKNKINIGKEDPIDVLRKTFGEAGLDAVDAIGDDLLNTQTYGEMNDLLTKNKLFNLKAKKVPGYDKSIQDAEELRMLDDFDIDPDRQPNAYGGIAGTLRLNRTGFKVGGIKKGIDLVAKYGPEFKKFADMLFIKASNMIRQGKGMWKGLDQKQMMQQHDNLTKKVNTFQKEGTLEGMDQYFGINAEKAFVETQAKVSAGQSKSINISDDAVAADFTNFIKKTDPEGYKKLEQTVELSNAKLGKGRKPNAEGGRVGMAKGGLPNILKL